MACALVTSNDSSDGSSAGRRNEGLAPGSPKYIRLEKNAENGSLVDHKHRKVWIVDGGSGPFGDRIDIDAIKLGGDAVDGIPKGTVGQTCRLCLLFSQLLLPLDAVRPESPHTQ